MNVRTGTKNIFNNQQKCVKISLFRIGLNNDKNCEGGGVSYQTHPLMLNTPLC